MADDKDYLEKSEKDKLTADNSSNDEEDYDFFHPHPPFLSSVLILPYLSLSHHLIPSLNIYYLGNC